MVTYNSWFKIEDQSLNRIHQNSFIIGCQENDNIQDHAYIS